MTTAYPERLTSAGIACVSELPDVEETSDGPPAAKKLKSESITSFQETSINLLDSRYARDKAPLVSDLHNIAMYLILQMPGCQCHACRNFSRAYIHHLLVAHELLGEVLLYAHNQHHMLRIFEVSRSLIRSNSFANWIENYLQANFL